MSDGEKRRLQEAYDVIVEALRRVKPDSAEGIQFTGMITVIGWQLDIPVPRDSMEKVLKGLKDFLRERHGIVITPSQN